MSKLAVSDSKDYFLKDGKPFFYLADTVWFAFSNTTLEEWEEYLDFRKIQGFNTLQISILPIVHDATESSLGLEPFERGVDGKLNFYNINDEYFCRAQKMLEMAVERGFIPALVLLWCDYVADTWAAKLYPDYVMPLEAMKRYTEYVVKAFERFNPVYSISGDTDMGSEKTAEIYVEAFKAVKAISPDTLTTFHLGAGRSEIPPEIENSSLLDFYMYQSGQMGDWQSNSHYFAGEFYKKPLKRPVVNGEPCYEGHGHGFKYVRFNDFDVRKAAWQSILSGAKAGFAYGAHGTWSWHGKGQVFNNKGFSGTPLDWRSALQLKGAWEVSYVKYIFETYRFDDLEPSSCVVNENESERNEVRAAVSRDKDKLVLYIPYNTDVEVNVDLEGYKNCLIILEDKNVATASVEVGSGISTIKMHTYNSDVLFIAVKK